MTRKKLLIHFLLWVVINFVTSYGAVYYVNDGNTTGDVYCTAVGSTNASAGTAPGTPAASLQQILDNYVLTGGDTVYVDTGVYSNQTVTITSADTGTGGVYWVIQGSTNRSAGGTVFDLVNQLNDGLYLSGSGLRWVRFNDIVIRNARYAVRLSLNTSAHEFNRVECYSSQFGFFLEGSASNRFDRCVVGHSTRAVATAGGSIGIYAGNQWDRGVLWSNVHGFYNVAPSTLSVSNTVIVGGNAIYSLSPPWIGPSPSDYNVFWDTIPIFGVDACGTLSDLQRKLTNNFHSTYADPEFADPAARDFHPRSKAGRYNPFTGTWTTDAVTSVLIDFGSLSAPYALEPMPNGGRMNAGSFGNTPEASKTPTNQAFLMTLTFNDGGSVSGTGRLAWLARSFPPSGTVRVDLSRDNGSSWTTLAGGIPATNGFYVWTNVNSFTSSAVCLWRVVGQTTNIAATNSRPFALRGIGPISYYVNDTNTGGDVYCTAAGSVTNTGLSPSSPKNALEHILANYFVGPGDIVYIDTGIYILTNSITVPRYAGGEAGTPMTIRGSTNWAVGGTVLTRQNTGSDVLVLEAGTRYVRLENLQLQRGRYGLLLNSQYMPHGKNLGCGFNEFYRVLAVSNVNGFTISDSMTNRFVSCVAAWNSNYGIYGDGNVAIRSGNTWNQGIVWGSGKGAFYAFSDIFSVSNSVFGSSPTGFAYEVAQKGDYVVFWNTVIGGGYPNLNELQKASGNWLNSGYLDPLFVDASGLDFHLKSVVGTYSNGVWVTYTNHSPCIDLGDPSSDYSNEPMPNGSNVNIGIYGNTTEASKSRTNAWLQVLNFNDGGVLTGGTGSTDRVIWRAGNYPPGATVRIEISLDQGLPGTWQTVVTGIAASAGYYIWTSTNIDSSSYYARWRVVYDHDTNIYSATTYTNFTFRSGPFRYYLNDTSTNGDVYCTAPGSDANLGTSPGSPMESLKQLLQVHDIEPGDVIYFDTGFYDVSGSMAPVIGPLDSGGTNGYVVIQGSTNYAAGGTVIARTGIGVSPGVGYLEFRNLSFTNLGYGLQLNGVSNITLSGVNAIRTAVGIYLDGGSTDVLIDRCALRLNGVGVQVDSGRAHVQNSVFWKNSEAGVRVNAGWITVTNSVVAAFGSSAAGYYSATATNISGNYNNLYAASNAIVGYIANGALQLDTLSAWSGAIGQERNSLDADPQFADPDAGDFHLKTETLQGRWVTAVGWYPGYDDVTSPLIDAGPPTWPHSNEVAYNGGRINIGLYGNTSEASKGRSNAWLRAASLRQGGWVRGTSTLHWVVGGSATGHTLKIEFSPDGGYTWSVLTNGISASQELYVWDTTKTNDTPAGLWRVSSISDTNVWDATTNFFAVRNGPLRFFINDTGTAYDAYCTAPGAPANWLAMSNKPLDSLVTLLAQYDIEPGDTIFIDTGYYSNNVNITWTRNDSGHPTNLIRVVGSTNALVSRMTVFDRGNTNFSAVGWSFEKVRGIVVSNIVIKQANVGCRISDGQAVTLSRLQSVNNSSNGLEIASSTNILIQRCVFAGNNSFGVQSVSNHGSIVQSVVWSNKRGAIIVAFGLLGVTQSVLHAYGSEKPVYTIGPSGNIAGDYNDLFTVGGAYVGVSGITPYKNLFRWQTQRTNETFSLAHDPLFADPAGGDFHERSTAGRYSPLVTGFVMDAQSSPLIDAGNPAWPYAAESAPNGGRVNIGLYGNDGQAGRTPTNGWLLALTLNDGGTINGTNYLRWLAGGAATGHLVYVDFSKDGGVTWTNIASNIAASVGYVIWDTTAYGSTPQGVWRVVSQTNPALYDETDNLFGVNNEPLTYYVNDTSTNGDIYCTAPGSLANDGRSQATPMSSLRELVQRYDLMPGDRVLVDTGTYNEKGSVVIGAGVQGESTNRVVIQGSSNVVYGGSQLWFSGNDGFVIRNTTGILLKDFTVFDASCGVWIDGARDCVVEGIDVRQSGTGFQVELATSNLLQNCSAVGSVTNGLAVLSSTGTVWESGLLWSNLYGLYMTRSKNANTVPSGDLQVRNSVFGVFGTNQIGWLVSGEAEITSDYNSWVVTNGAAYATVPATPFDFTYYTLIEMTRERGWEAHSISKWPRYYNASGGDFHLLSRGGRYNPATGYFVTDSVTSPLLDAGDPTSVFTNESAPNGKRINIGRYGNSWQASRTATNAELTLISLNDGGSVTGSVFIYWVARGAATSHTVRLRYSYDGGSSWTIIASGLPATSTGYLWNTISASNSLLGVLRVESESMGTVYDQTDQRFAVRNAPFSFYVNDSSTNGDVYCTATGSPANSGLTPSAPKSSLLDVLNSYDLEAGDIVYVDTGFYTITQTVEFTQADANRDTNLPRVVVQGSTNYAAGGTIFDGSSLISNAVITVSQGVGIELRDLTVRGAFAGVRLTRSVGCRMVRVRAERCVRGFELDYNEDTEMLHCVLRDSSQAGLYHLGSSNSLFQSGVLWSNSAGVFMSGSTNFGQTLPNRLSFSNNVAVAFGTNQQIFSILSGFLFSDYNNLFVTNGAKVSSGRHRSVGRWAFGTSNDTHSLSHDPLFADPVNGDFHLKSRGGRFTSIGTVVTDAVSSLLVDAGDPLATYTNETMPNGARVNIGLYGNTSEASRSPTNSSLTAVSLSDGGRAGGTNVMLYWVARGNATGHLVAVDYSGDGGVTWTNLASSLPATNRFYVWNAAAFPSSLRAKWRVRSLTEPAVYDETDQYFALRNVPLSFYVNDGSALGDVYCTAIGSAANDGLTPASPKPSISSLLSSWVVEPGDVLYVDTGVYTSSAPIVLVEEHSGDTNALLMFTLQGSTNIAGTGTLLVQTNADTLLWITNAPMVQIRYIRLDPQAVGISFGSSERGRLEHVYITGGDVGIALYDMRDAEIAHCLVRNTGTALYNEKSVRSRCDSSVLWSNNTAVLLQSGGLSISNSVMAAWGTNATIYYLPVGGALEADYNAVWVNDGAMVAYQPESPFPRIYRTVSRWVRDLNVDVHSFAGDPLFADPETGDFHLRSQGGRFNPATGTFTNDSVTSPLIDAGAQTASFTNEPMPNGGRRNIGLYGGTWQASKSPTNARLTAVSLNDGGRVEGAKILYWIAAGAATGQTVRVQFSSDAGSSWTTLETGIPANTGSYVWDSRLVPSTIRGMWRVVTESGAIVTGIVQELFAVRNEPLNFYVNDSSTNGDVYTTAIGNSANSGATPSSPKDSIAGVLATWDLEPGDTIFVDTGTYVPQSEAVQVYQDVTWMPEWGTNLSILVAGLATSRVSIVGSTNVAAGGSLLTRFGGGPLFDLQYASGVALRNLIMSDGGIAAQQSHYLLFDSLEISGGSFGVDLTQCNFPVIRNSIVRNTDSRGITLSDCVGVTGENLVIWSNRFYGVFQESPVLKTATLSLQNSLVAAFGSNSFAYFNVRGVWTSDYNCVYTREQAFPAGVIGSGMYGGSTTRYETIYRWFTTYGQDRHTLTPTSSIELADANTGDFHLKTTAYQGRYVPTAGGWTNDTTPSILLDSGNPASPWTNEPSPNGNAVDIGAYGNTWQASKTPTNAGWFSILTLNDGGVVYGTVTLHWVAGGIATGHYVNVDFSPVAGLFWTNIVTSNPPAARSSIEWDTTQFGRSFAGLWRVVSCQDTNIYDISDRYLTLSTNVGGSVWYFVNDNSTNGDIYCIAPGSVTNEGFSPDAPALSIKAILDSRTLEPGDRIYVDTGTYNLTADIEVNDLDSGTPEKPVYIIGSTNWLAGGTVLNRQVPGGGTRVFALTTARNVILRHLTLKNGAVGIGIGGFSEKCALEDVRIENCGSGGGYVEDSSEIRFDRVLIWNNKTSTNGFGIRFARSSSNELNNCVVWDNLTALVFENADSVSLRNNVLHASGYGHRVFRFDISSSPGLLDSDYNNFIFENNAILAEREVTVGGNDVYETLTAWQLDTGSDAHSLSHLPFFADSVNGDFHETAVSPLIDTGDPAYPYTNEPAPNGARINLGIYGNTDGAATSVTNPWLLAVSVNDGGTIGGTQTLRWTSGNFTNGATVQLQYSPNGGIEWYVIASNVLVSLGSYDWNLTGYAPGNRYLWRVVSESDITLADPVDKTFTIKNANLTIYVNDGETNGDVYCTAAGSPANTGLSPSSPLASILAALTNFPVGPGDTIYVDTGVYTNALPMLFDVTRRGESGSYIRVIGSTNWIAGGTVIERSGTGYVVQCSSTRDIWLENLRLKKGTIGLYVQSSERIVLRNSESFSNSLQGVNIEQGNSVSLDHCAIWANAHWGLRLAAGSVSLNQSTIASNRLGAIKVAGGGVAVSNSILIAATTNALVYEVGPGGIGGDYNVLWYPKGGRLGRQAQTERNYRTLQEWQSNENSDTHSFVADPLFVDPAGGDFHLQSAAGRWSYAITNWVADTNTSWAIDAASWDAVYTNEPMPNGSRANAGRFGNTAEASLSVTGGPRELKVATLDDGGVVAGVKTLVWLSRGMGPTNTVRLEYSRDNGATWHVIATNVNALAADYAWDLSAIASSPLSYWKVTDESAPAISATNEIAFVIRNSPIYYYVNDTSTVGDVYCTAPGNSTNLGYSPAQPKARIQEIVNTYDVEPGDVVYVDTGLYPWTDVIELNEGHSGDATNRVTIIGSTNRNAGGTTLRGSSVNKVFNLKQVKYVTLAHLTITGAQYGVYFDLGCQNNVLSNMLICNGFDSGVAFVNAQNNEVRHSVVTRISGVGVRSMAASGNRLDSCVVWSNTSHAVHLLNGTLSVSNSILFASGASNMCYYIVTNGTMQADYNILFTTNGAPIGNVLGVPQPGLPQWNMATTQDLHSLNTDPLFQDPLHFDFHERNQMGRYDPGLGTYVYTDTVISAAIDMGAPSDPWSNEPAPNGARRNIGLFGNTSQAGKSRTNAWVKAITADSGGRLQGIVYLAWNAVNVAPTNTVRLEYSHDNGSSWTTIVAGISVTNYQYLWDTTATHPGGAEKFWSSPLARWKITLEAATNINDMTAQFFALRNHPFSYYLNDGSTNGDIYCTAPGDDANLGIFPNIPKLTLKNALQSWDLEGDDTVYIDTGNYVFTTNDLVVWDPGDAGAEGAPLIVMGNTNSMSSIFTTSISPAPTLVSLNGTYIVIRDLGVVGGSWSAAGGNVTLQNMFFTNGTLSLSGPAQLLEDVTVMNGSVSAMGGSDSILRRLTVGGGQVTLSGTNIVMENSLVYGNVAVAVQMSGGDITLRNNTLVGNGTQFRQSGVGNAHLENNIIVANGSGNFCIYKESGTLISDYNNLVARGGAWIGNVGNEYWEKLIYWQRESGQDLHSISIDPLFADESARDYHLRSVVGRWTSSGWTNDATHSPCIDMGKLTSVYTNEPAPNGGRVNIGAYGNSSQASKSRTNAWLQVMTMNDGGVIKGTNILRWASGNLGTGDLVQLEYSWDSGTNWVTIASGLPATAGYYEWDSTSVASSLRALWRVTLTTNTSVQSVTATNFSVRNVPLRFYVNDSSTNGDVYCTAAGSALNSGLDSNVPVHRLDLILNNYDLEGGDVVYVDTGNYGLLFTLQFIWSDGGDDQSGNVVIQGSTNYAAGGSVFNRNNLYATTFDVRGSHYTFRDLIMQRANVGISFVNNRYSVIERVVARSNIYGIAVSGASSITNRNLILWNNQIGGVLVSGARTVRTENCSFVGGSNFAYFVTNTVSNVLQNNIFYLTETNSVALDGDSNVLRNTFIDYNIYWFASPSTRLYGSYVDLQDWQLTEGHDFRSAITNPLFANVDGGDFHLKSTAGRYAPGTGWVVDAENSWGIDRGNPDSDYSTEPAPRGNRINIGAYGGTEQASKGTTNAVVTVRSLNEATWITETNSLWALIWSIQNVPTSETFNVQFSGDGGASWYDLATNLNAYREFILWQTTPFFNTYKGRWRVIGQSNTNYWDINDAPFEIFYGTFAISEISSSSNMPMIKWRGAWDERYQVQYSTNLIHPSAAWINAPTGSGPYQIPYFLSTNGGDFYYEDVSATNVWFRTYRIMWVTNTP